MKAKTEIEKYVIEKSKLSNILEDIEELSRLLTERISDLHEVPGMMQARHAYIYYREKLYRIREEITHNITPQD